MSTFVSFLKCFFVLLSLAETNWYKSSDEMPERIFRITNVPVSSLQEIVWANKPVALRDIFTNLNVVRQVGTTSHRIVGKYIKRYLRSRGWDIQVDKFEQSTPIGNKTFRNIISSYGPLTSNHLVLACHYDSKLFEGFVGSTDSAMPCSILLKIADSLTLQLANHTRMHLGVKLLFLDGEEAFVEWTANDSLYGARHLASLWGKDGPDGRTELSKIRLFVLLDLIGSAGIVIPSYQYNYEMAYNSMKNLEYLMSASHLLLGNRNGTHKYFHGYNRRGYDDDHLPFMQQGVPILHLIPYPPPPVWHLLSDNATNIDWNTSLDILNIVNAFVHSVLHLL